jgi:hypothetical protein
MPSSWALRAAAILLAISVDAAETLERVLVVVDERPVFLSDVRTVEWMDHLERKDALERVIDETLLFREAIRLPQVTNTADGASSPANAEPGPGGAASRARTLARRAAIRRYAAFRFRPQIRLDEEAIREAYRERWGSAANPPDLNAVAPDLREELMAQAIDRRVAAWAKDLRAVAHIRYNALD